MSPARACCRACSVLTVARRFPGMLTGPNPMPLQARTSVTSTPLKNPRSSQPAAAGLTQAAQNHVFLSSLMANQRITAIGPSLLLPRSLGPRRSWRRFRNATFFWLEFFLRESGTHVNRGNRRSGLRASGAGRFEPTIAMPTETPRPDHRLIGKDCKRQRRVTHQKFL